MILSTCFQLVEDGIGFVGTDRHFEARHKVGRGTVPILFGAALRAFAEAIALRRDESYLDDVLPSVIEAICLSHSDSRLRWPPLMTACAATSRT